jgi:hypothetical protein
MENTIGTIDPLTLAIQKGKQADREGENAFFAAIQGLDQWALSALVQQIDAKGPDVTDFEAGLKNTAQAKIQDIEVQQEMDL